MSLPDGNHTVNLNKVGAQFRGAESETIGGFVADVTVNVAVVNGKATIVDGSWSQSIHKPIDQYDFYPLWSTHRSLNGNILTLGLHVVDAVLPPWTPSKPYGIAILGTRNLELPQNGYSVPPPKCFLAGTPITMADGSEKPIEEVEPEDWVLSYDKDGNLKPGRVTQTFTNTAKQILDVHGLMVTPGHVTLCGDGEFEGQHVPIMDILRSDGALVMKDGSKIRAATGCPLGSIGDRFIHAIIGESQPDGRVKVSEVGQLRLGTRFINEDGEDISIEEIIYARGGMLTEDGYIKASIDGPKMPFRWTNNSKLPKPEDYILQRSATTLSHVYQVGEWEAVGPQMPMPRFPNLPDAAISRNPAVIQAAPANVPLSMRDGARTPSKPRRTMSRKQRRAAEANARKASKAKKVTVH
ncbi:Hint domain-containing protein [Cohaesibacter celericrescens]|uniref:Hedgehog/Intein (Hint) domain-containing protein n=1 Tax=Cohaesibacter celericrescens TaxID=2067669 RepID=A0A2N5XUZ8_9HYPH|nr:Hint domain-containing protein [Cohaesibacter celericrescens]PLW78342.1 hypothetical protein C0081_04395 [Cohaesibacter celericrescens]